MMDKTIRELNSNLKSGLEGYKSMTLCDIESSEVLFSENLNPDFDLQLILACNLEVIKAKLYALEVMGIDDEVDAIVVFLKNEVHIIDLTEDKKCFVYLTIDGVDVNIDTAKQILSGYRKKLNKPAFYNLYVC